MDDKTINLTEARDFGDTLSDAFKLLQFDFKPLMKILLTYVGPFLLITGFLTAWQQSKMLGNMLSLDRLNSNPFEIYSNMLSPQYFLMIIAMVVSNILLVVAVLSYIKLYKTKGRANFEAVDVWKNMQKHFFPVLGGILLISLVLSIGGIVIASTLAISPIITGILIFFYIFFAIYVSISISLFAAANVLEDLSIIEAIKRSRYLIKNYWWFTFGLIIVASLVASVGQYLFMAPQILLTTFTAYTKVSGGDSLSGSSVLITVFGVIGTFASYLLYVIPNTVIAFHFYSQVEKKDNPTLLNRIENIG